MVDKAKVSRADARRLQAELDKHAMVVSAVKRPNGTYESDCKCGIPLRSATHAEDHFVEVAFLAGWNAHKASMNKKGRKA